MARSNSPGAAIEKASPTDRWGRTGTQTLGNQPGKRAWGEAKRLWDRQSRQERETRVLSLPGPGTLTLLLPCGLSWCARARGATSGLCALLNRSLPPSRPGTSSSPPSVAGTSKNGSALRKANGTSTPCVCSTSSCSTTCSCWSHWPVGVCSLCSPLHSSVPMCSGTGVSVPTAAGGGQTPRLSPASGPQRRANSFQLFCLSPFSLTHSHHLASWLS